MHKLREILLPVLILAAQVSPLAAQIKPDLKAAPAASKPDDASGKYRTIPEDDVLYITSGSKDKYTVSPARLYDTPYFTVKDLATVNLVQPAQEELADTITIEATGAQGGTTLVLPLVQEDRRFVRRVEVLIVSQVSEADKAYLMTTVKRLFPTVNIDILIPNAQTAVLSGYVDKAEIVAPIQELVRSFLASRLGGQVGQITVVNALRVTGAQEVQLKVVVAEVQRTKARSLGFDWFWQDLTTPGMGLIGSLGAATTPGAAFTGPAVSSTMGLLNTPAVNGVNNVPFSLFRLNQFVFVGQLQALVANGLASILAEPVLVTMSGKPAFFNQGTEEPIVAAGGVGAAQVEFRQIGTNVRFLPTVLGDGRIRMDVRPEVSTFVANITAANFTAPRLQTRVVETTVELESGQTLAIAGLIDRRRNAVTTKLPVLGDLPLIGWAFQHKSYTTSETELMIFVTPHLVDATNEGICRLPGRESRIPNDVEWYLGSKFEPPCFDDPYRKHYYDHMHNVPDPVPPQDRQYDNYGRPDPGIQYPNAQTNMTSVTAVSQNVKSREVLKRDGMPGVLSPAVVADLKELKPAKDDIYLTPAPEADNEIPAVSGPSLTPVKSAPNKFPSLDEEEQSPEGQVDVASQPDDGWKKTK